MPVSIRRSKPVDLKAIQDLNADLFRHDAPWISHMNMDWPYESENGEAYFRKTIEGTGEHISFVAEDKDRVVGYLAGRIRKPESYRDIKLAELDNMIVDDKYRHQGIGKQLVESFKKWCIENGAQKILVIASEPNHKAIRFYRSVGFEPYSLELEMDLENQS